ncbi:MAG: hypothetical protein H0X62_10475, partial [Bacteroidetes bacterium]|nr:hypothetical protein [Bacteroidota bacterium]
NTTSALYAIDRNGDNVEHFPVSFSNKATAPITVFDYDKNKDYRILVSTQDKKIHNYSAAGEPVKGWVMVPLENQVKLPMQHVDIAGKDYLIGLDEIGKVYVVGRNGESRVNLKEKLPVKSFNNTFYLERGKGLSKTFLVTTDSVGTVFKLNLADELEKKPLKEFSVFHKMDFKDLNGDKNREYIYIDGNKLFAFNSLKHQKFEHEFKNKILSPAQFFLFPDGYGRIGVTDANAEEIYLFDEAGNIYRDFPLKGATQFSIGNINQDNNLNLVCGSGRNIYLYQLK